MSEDEDFYRPEQIDEQVDALLQARPMPELDQHMVHDLRITLANADAEADARSLQRVLQQLLQDEHSPHRQSGENISSLELIQQQKQKRVAHMKETQRFRPLARVFSTLAAALIIAALVGSMLIITHSAQQNKGGPNTSTGAVQQPTSQAEQPQGLYSSSRTAVFRLNAQTHQAIWQQALPDVSKIIPVGKVVYVLQSSQNTKAVNEAVALDADSGKILWKHPFAADQDPTVTASQTAGMVFAQNRLYVSWKIWVNNSYNDGQVYGLDASNGNQVSVYTHVPEEAMDAGDGILAIANTNVQVYSTATNKLLWQASMAGKNTNVIVLSVKIVNNLLYVIFTSNRDVSAGQGYIAAYQVSTGKQVWQSPSFTADELSQFVVEKNIIYFGEINLGTEPFSGKIYAYDIQSNKQLWSTSVNGGAQESFVISNGTVYTAIDQGGKLDSHLIALNAANGAITWQQTLNTVVLSGFSISNGTIYVGSKEGYSKFGSNIAAFNANAGGQLLWRSTDYGYTNLVPTV